MKVDRLNESELKEILAIAQEGESKLKEMSDRATILSEKWRVKILKPKNSNSKKMIERALNFCRAIRKAIASIPSLHQFETIIIKMTRSVLKLCQH